jgi:hypothetical protein
VLVTYGSALWLLGRVYVKVPEESEWKIPRNSTIIIIASPKPYLREEKIAESIFRIFSYCLCFTNQSLLPSEPASAITNSQYAAVWNVKCFDPMRSSFLCCTRSNVVQFGRKLQTFRRNNILHQYTQHGARTMLRNFWNLFTKIHGITSQKRAGLLLIPAVEIYLQNLQYEFKEVPPFRIDFSTNIVWYSTWYQTISVKFVF